MAREREEGPAAAVRVYTVCDESRYLIVRNVPALGCGHDLQHLFASYGDVQECTPMDEEDCEPYTDVYWIKFALISNARFAKKKLDEFAFLGNRLKVSYAPHFETLADTKAKLECRRQEVLARLRPGKNKVTTVHNLDSISEPLDVASPLQVRRISEPASSRQKGSVESGVTYSEQNPPVTMVCSNQNYFPSPSMNNTVQLVREKLDKIQSSSSNIQVAPASKKARLDNRRRI
ncbi:hypothetical protein Syun_031000 [Stephania yunnanensis]|uniref:RNA-binding protein 48 n=1 Tax=Stephania yunnanensis TaxID=152371 RepID=A0AAP0HBC8_9MAGN